MKRLSLIILVATITTFASCVKDGNGGPNRNGVGNRDVTLTLVTPSKLEAGLTRAQLPTADENNIASATVVVFAQNGVYDYHKTSTDITAAADIKVKINLRSDGASYDLLVLTNISEHFTDAQIKTALGGSTIDQAYSKLQMAAMTKYGWGGDKFVMSGIKKGFALTSTVTDIGVISLIRSLASVDIGLKWNKATKVWDGLNNFKLEEVYIYNANGDYTVMPEIGNYVDDGFYKKVTKPTIHNFTTNTAVASSLGNKSGEALHFDASNITIAGTALNNSGDGQNLTSKIYIPEIINDEGGMARADRPAVVVKGAYGGSSYYYRIDFTVKEGSIDKTLNILRNHKYRFSITDVQGPGHLTPDEAFDSKSFNIEVVVEDWDEYDMNNTESNGQYYVQYSARELYFTQFGAPIGSNVLTIKTNQTALTFGDLVDVTAGAGDGTWTEAPAGRWTNGHFTALFAKGGTVGSETTYTITVTALPTVSGDPSRETTARIKGRIISTGVRFTQDKHSEFRLVGTPDPMIPITLDGTGRNSTTGRFEIGVTSTHNYQIVTSDANMINNFYDTPTGGTLLDKDDIPKDVSTLYIDIGAHIGIVPRIATVQIKHGSSLSDAPALLYTIVQIQPTLQAYIGGLNSATVPIEGGTVSISVASNLTKWVVNEFKVGGLGGTAIPEADWSKYLDRVFGTGSGTVKFVLGENTSGENPVYTINFKDSNSSLTSQLLTITQKSKIYSGYPAVKGILAVDSNGELNIDGEGYLLHFKWGSLIGLSTDIQYEVFNNESVSKIVLYTPDGFNGEPKKWTGWAEIPYLSGGYDQFHLTGKVIDPAKNNKGDGIGDPCALITKVGGVTVPEGTYKMPANGYWISGTAWGGTQNWYTKGDFSSSSVGIGVWGNEPGGAQEYHAIGSRSSAGIDEYEFGRSGYYWSGTVQSSLFAYYLTFNKNLIRVSEFTSFGRGYACPVRCIKK